MKLRILGSVGAIKTKTYLNIASFSKKKELRKKETRFVNKK